MSGSLFNNCQRQCPTAAKLTPNEGNCTTKGQQGSRIRYLFLYLYPFGRQSNSDGVIELTEILVESNWPRIALGGAGDVGGALSRVTHELKRSHEQTFDILVNYQLLTPFDYCPPPLNLLK